VSASDRVFYFSNGTEGSIWMADNCDRCVGDHAMHVDQDDVDHGCPHILSMICGTHDDAFVRIDNDRGYDDLHCTKFSRCPCNRGLDDPGVELPPPIDPNQGALFDVERVMPGVWRCVVLDELTQGDA
jgi:hypothetical protein